MRNLIISYLLIICCKSAVEVGFKVRTPNFFVNNFKYNDNSVMVQNERWAYYIDRRTSLDKDLIFETSKVFEIQEGFRITEEIIQRVQDIIMQTKTSLNTSPLILENLYKINKKRKNDLENLIKEILSKNDGNYEIVEILKRLSENFAIYAGGVGEKFYDNIYKSFKTKFDAEFQNIFDDTFYSAKRISNLESNKKYEKKVEEIEAIDKRINEIKQINEQSLNLDEDNKQKIRSIINEFVKEC